MNILSAVFMPALPVKQSKNFQIGVFCHFYEKKTADFLKLAAKLVKTVGSNRATTPLDLQM